MAYVVPRSRVRLRLLGRLFRTLGDQNSERLEGVHRSKLFAYFLVSGTLMPVQLPPLSWEVLLGPLVEGGSDETLCSGSSFDDGETYRNSFGVMVGSAEL
jgi:hypothetical protein